MGLVDSAPFPTAGQSAEVEAPKPAKKPKAEPVAEVVEDVEVSE